MSIYLDGSISAGSPTAAIGNYPSTHVFRMGRRSAVNDYWFDGTQDEVRISNIARTLGWIAATNAGLTDVLVIYGDHPLAVNIDVVLKKLADSKTAAVDIMLKTLAETKTISLDTLLMALGITKTAAIDIILKAIDTKTVAADIFLRATDTKTAAIDLLLRKLGDSKTAAVDVYLQETSVSTADLDALLRATDSKTAAVDLMLKGLGITKTADLDVLLVGRVSKTASLNINISARGTVGLSIDIVLSKPGLPSRRFILEVRKDDGDLICILNNAVNIAYRELINSAHVLSFKIKTDDSKVSEITKARQLWIRDYETDTVVKKFKLATKEDDR